MLATMMVILTALTYSQLETKMLNASLSIPDLISENKGVDGKFKIKIPNLIEMYQKGPSMMMFCSDDPNYIYERLEIVIPASFEEDISNINEPVWKENQDTSTGGRPEQILTFKENESDKTKHFNADNITVVYAEILATWEAKILKLHNNVNEDGLPDPLPIEIYSKKLYKLLLEKPIIRFTNKFISEFMVEGKECHADGYCRGGIFRAQNSATDPVWGPKDDSYEIDQCSLIEDPEGGGIKLPGLIGVIKKLTLSLAYH